MNAKKFEKLLKELDACKPARVWAKGKSFKEVWDTCEGGDWMLWLAIKMQGRKNWTDLRNLTLAKARCAKLAIHMMKDERSRDAVHMAERFGLNQASMEELASASAAASDASAAYPHYGTDHAVAAAMAADASDVTASAHGVGYYIAVRKSARRKCAKICRETLNVPKNG